MAESRGNTDEFRLYYMENTMHGDVAWLENNMVTNYLGALQQALLDVSAWVEKGIEPLPDTEYRYENGQMEKRNRRESRQKINSQKICLSSLRPQAFPSAVFRTKI